MTSGAVSAFLVRQRIHELMRQFTEFGEDCTFSHVKSERFLLVTHLEDMSLCCCEEKEYLAKSLCHTWLYWCSG